jgi:hypothetical protein
MIPNCTHSDAIDKITPALVAALAKIDPATKDAVNPHLKNKYADLSAVMDAAKPALAESGIAIMQPPECEGKTVKVSTILLHGSGQWYASAPLSITAIDDRAQSIGSAITYARRYSLSGMLGITAEDDDGNGASGTTANGNAQRKADPPKPASQYKTQASADTAERRIAEERAKAEAAKKAKAESLDKSLQVGVTDLLPPADPKPWNTMRELKAIFARVKAAYGAYEGSYLELMRRFGTEDPGQFKDGATALACYGAHLDRLREMEAMKEAAK